MSFFEAKPETLSGSRHDHPLHSRFQDFLKKEGACHRERVVWHCSPLSTLHSPHTSPLTQNEGQGREKRLPTKTLVSTTTITTTSYHKLKKKKSTDDRSKNQGNGQMVFEPKGFWFHHTHQRFITNDRRHLCPSIQHRDRSRVSNPGEFFPLEPVVVFFRECFGSVNENFGTYSFYCRLRIPQYFRIEGKFRHQNQRGRREHGRHLTDKKA